MKEELSNQQKIVTLIAESISDVEREPIKLWLQGILEIHNSDVSKTMKAKNALNITIRNKILWPVIKLISRKVKLHTWDNRSKAMRRSYGVAALAIALLGNQAAGIAALGGAIGIPLWMVFGGGALFAQMLYIELSKGKSQATLPKTKYTVIDAEKDES